jgi:hypothetical protein
VTLRIPNIAGRGSGPATNETPPSKAFRTTLLTVVGISIPHCSVSAGT